MTLESAKALLVSADYLDRLEAQLLISARAIQVEDPSTALHAKRVKIADALLYRQNTYSAINSTMARLVIADNATIRATTLPLSDPAQFESDLEYVVAVMLSTESVLDALGALV